MPYTINCPEELLDVRRFREIVIQILDTISTDIARVTDVEILELYDVATDGSYNRFLRFIITDIDGAKTVVDTELDGTTPYVVAATVKTSVTDTVTQAFRTINITPNDGADLSEPVNWIQSGGAGTVTFDTIGGTTSTQGITTGGYIWAKIKKVYATGTSATGLVGYISE